VPAVRRPLLFAAVVLVAAAPASAWVGPEQKTGDLDGDDQAETVRSERVDVPGAENAFDQTEIRVADTCPDGRQVDARIAGPQENLALMRLKPADTRPGREVFVDLRSGAAGRLGEARLVAWRESAGSPCRVPRNLFFYKDPTRPPRGATRDVSSFLVSVRDMVRRYRGLEIALDERFLRRGDANCCGTYKKVSYWRYSGKRDRYVRFRTVVRRVRFLVR
jgi:hypothetical protein